MYKGYLEAYRVKRIVLLFIFMLLQQFSHYCLIGIVLYLCKLLMIELYMGLFASYICRFSSLIFLYWKFLS
jgi:hypothetical protein